MADLTIRKDFVEGIYEVFTTLFNEGVEDGIYLYRVKESTPNVYGERKEKYFEAPILLVSTAKLDPTFGAQPIEDIKNTAEFKVPLKSLQLNNVELKNSDLDSLRDSIIEFQGVFYEVLNVKPTTYIEDVFLFYTFECKEDKLIHSMEGSGNEFYTV